MQTNDFRRFALRPKEEPQDLPFPVLPQHNWGVLSHLISQLAPPERRVLREIAQGGDLLIVAGRPWLVVPLSQDALDTIAAFEAEGEDMEQDQEDFDGVDQEKDISDDEPDDFGEDEGEAELEQHGSQEPGPSFASPTVAVMLREKLLR